MLIGDKVNYGNGVKLERGKIVDEALNLLNEQGLDQLSTRRLAERLGVQQPALYWHFKSKNALLDAMNEEILRRGHSHTAPAAGEPWDAFVLENARSFRRALLAYRDGARVHAGNEPSDETLASSEALLEIMLAAGFDETTIVYGMISVGNYVVGSVLEQQAAIERPLPTQIPREKTAAAPRLFQLVNDLLAQGADKTAEQAFETGLELIVEGLRGRLAGTGKRRRQATKA